jgi:carboxypeptidase family protein
MKAIFSLISVALLGGIFLFLWQAPGSVREPGFSPNPAEVGQPTGDAALAVAEGPTSTDNLGADGIADGPPQRTPAESSQPRTELEEAGRISVRVVHADSLKPIEGASVYFLQEQDLDEAKLEKIRGLAQSGSGFDVIVQKFGRTETSNRKGEVSFTWSGAEGVAFARLGEEQALETTENAVDGVVTLKLKPIHGVTVQVVDPSGVAQFNVPVELRVTAKAANGEPDIEMTFLTKITAEPEGQVEFTGYTGLLKIPSDPHPKYSVRLGVPGIHPTEKPLTEDLSPRDVVVLELPPCGPLEVRTYQANGDPLLIQGSVTLDLAEANWSDDSPNPKADLVDGVASFAYVGLNAPLEATVESKTSGIRWQARGRGPSSAAEVAILRVVAPERVVLSGKLLQADGSPYASSPCSVVLRSESRAWLQSTPSTTDKDGRFQIEIGKEVKSGSEISVLVAAPYQMRLKTRADMVGLIKVGDADIDIGTLTLQDAIGQISGQCVDERGNPAAGVQVVVQQDFDRFGSSANSDASGQFNISGIFAEQTTLEVRANEWVIPEPMHVQVDGQPVQVVVYPAGRITGSLVESSTFGFDDFSLNLYLIKPGPEKTLDWQGSCKVNSQTGAFQLEHLPPGEYELRLSVKGGAEIASLTKLSVQIGQTTLDPRLQPWDYAVNLHTINFQVVDESGNRVRNASCMVYRGQKIVAWSNQKEGWFECSYQDPTSCRVVVEADGFRPTTLPGEMTSQTVVLSKGIPVTLITANRPPLKKGDRRVSLELRKLGANVKDASAAGVWVPEQLVQKGQGQIYFPGPGSYQLYASYFQAHDSGMVLENQAILVKGVPLLEIREPSVGMQLVLELPANLFD